MSQTIYLSELRSSISHIRRFTVLLAIDRLGMRDKLISPNSMQIKEVSSTERRIILAGEALGMLTRNQNSEFQWSEQYTNIAGDLRNWSQYTSLIRHQRTYLNLVDNIEDHSSIILTPSEQIQVSPDEYKKFLQGVAASHRHHATWFASLAVLSECQTLADIGGGLGIYAQAWVESDSSRKATVIDLPEVGNFIEALINSHDDRLEFTGIDLTKGNLVINNADVYLLANVIHLLPNWKTIIHKIIQLAKPREIVAIFEANPTGYAGILFDLQVHLRSGLRTGLIDGEKICQTMLTAGLVDVLSMQTSDPDDPFERQYILWIGVKL